MRCQYSWGRLAIHTKFTNVFFLIMVLLQLLLGAEVVGSLLSLELVVPKCSWYPS